MESNLLTSYLIYKAVFLSPGGMSQFAFVFALPVIKAILKRLLAKVVADLEDLVPAVVISIELFNALYQSKCMQSSGFGWTTLAIIIIDAIQNCISLYKLFKMMREIQGLVVKDLGSDDLLSYVLELVKEPEKLDMGSSMKLCACSFERRVCRHCPESTVCAVQGPGYRKGC